MSATAKQREGLNPEPKSRTTFNSLFGEQQAGKPKPKPAATRHHLCLRDPFPGQKSCWCMCEQCWNKATSRCVCGYCPCPSQRAMAIESLARPLPGHRISEMRRGT